MNNKRAILHHAGAQSGRRPARRGREECLTFDNNASTDTDALFPATSQLEGNYGVLKHTGSILVLGNDFTIFGTLELTNGSVLISGAGSTLENTGTVLVTNATFSGSTSGLTNSGTIYGTNGALGVTDSIISNGGRLGKAGFNG